MQGATTSDACVGEFVSDGATTTLEWDIIPMGANAALEAAPAATTLGACQAACSASSQCQYFVFRDYEAAASRCKLRLAGGPIAKLAFAGEDAPATPQLFLEVKESLYTVYAAKSAADAEAVGETLSTFKAFGAARKACDGDLSCVGFSWNTTHWRTFAGVKWEGAIGKVRVVGETLNSWIAEPISD